MVRPVPYGGKPAVGDCEPEGLTLVRQLAVLTSSDTEECYCLYLVIQE